MPGRREYMKYRDLGVIEASGGAMRAQIMSTTGQRTEPTGWHYHVCDGQFVYVLRGWVDLSFEDGTSIRLKANESLYLPGGFRHRETATSVELEILEVAVPADLGTVKCESPFD
jgi:quercetin dioxygenase-like cupin family protein